MPELDEQTQQMLAACSHSTLNFASVFLEDRFFRPFSSLHKQVFDLIDNTDKQIVCILAPRGIGKTSSLLAYCLRNILFQEAKFIVYISKSQTHAMDQTENIKGELMANPMFRDLFGAAKADNFSKEQWEVETGIKVVPRGAGQQIRGLLYKRYRPDRIVIDDLEDPEAVLNEESRAKLWQWFNADVKNSIDRGSKDWKIIIIGTMLHEDSVLAKLAESKDCETIRLSICDENYNSNWPEFISTEEVRELADSFSQNGLADVFAREYMNVPISMKDAAFKSSYFQYYTEEELRLNNTHLETVVIVDPARSTNSTSDYSTVVAIGLDPNTGILYIRDLVMDRLHPDDIYAKTIDMCRRFQVSSVGIEVTGLNEFIVHPFKNALLRAGSFIELVELKARGKKEHRIAALIPYYRTGLIKHNKSGCCRVLEGQMMSFPRSKYDDAMDAVAYIIEMLELGSRYLVGTNNAFHIEKQYEDLAASYPALDPLPDDYFIM